MKKILVDESVLKQALEALEQCGLDDSHRSYEKESAAKAALRAALEQLVPHGCHCDLEEGMVPDGCVLDEGRPDNCVYAPRLLREGKDKTACEYWKPIEVKR